MDFLNGRRQRRLRHTNWVRHLTRENTLTPADLIYPIFLAQGHGVREPVLTMPGVNRLSVDEAVKEAKVAYELGIPMLAFFPNTPVELLSENGDEATNPDNLVCQALRAIKKAVPQIGLMADVAMDPYTTHGHDGVLRDECVLNDETVEILVAQSLNQALAGADVIAPSDMMDGRVGAIRRALDNGGFTQTIIMSYAAKYASCFYGPFRDAVGSKGRLQGDKRTYQMDAANSEEALREVAQDIEEGADIVIVKPGMPYLDIIQRISDNFSIPLVAYQVSGEYAMICMGAEAGIWEREAAMMESLVAFKRAGCSGILTYFALDAARLLTA
ncbi:MAG: porphobilinogen synthase [Devosiaceae bacterium]|nr:porphobilinogen synthase [Devosiaceae bacterium]